MRYVSVIRALFCLAVGSSAHAGVEYWNVVKAEIYEQAEDHVPPDSASNYVLYVSVETTEASDAASIDLRGGNIPGTYSLEQNDTEWELLVLYPSKAAMDAELPGSANFELILNGAGGSVTQAFTFGADDFAPVPYLKGSGFSRVTALDVLEPIEMNWNDPGEGVGTAVQLNEGTLFDGEEVFYDEVYENRLSSWFWGELAPGTFYTGAIEFVKGTNFYGTGFAADGEISFNRLTQFAIDTENSAVAFDDFNDDSVNTNLWSPPFPDGAGLSLSETNGQWVWAGLAGGEESMARVWDGCLSATQDWSVAVDIYCLPEPSAMTNRELWIGLALLPDGNLDQNMAVEYNLGEWGRSVYTGVSSNDTDIISAEEPLDAAGVSLKISYDADAQMFYSAYSFGGDYAVQEAVPAAAFAGSASDFCPAVFFGGTNVSVSAGQVTMDNFRVYEGVAMSNEIGLVELEFLHSYGDGTIFTEGNWIKVDVQTSHNVKQMEVTTSGGDSFDVPLQGEDGPVAKWDIDVEFPFEDAWDSANDGVWTLTVALVNGFVASVQYPFLKADGNPLPNFYHSPVFVSPSPSNGSRVNTNAFSFAWNAATSEANHISVEEIIGDNETGSFSLLFADDVPGADLEFLNVDFDGPLSTTNAGPFTLGDGFRRVRINEGYARAAYNDEGLPFLVVKINEADIVFTITGDVDNDKMDDDWEIQYFGSTNAVNGGALDNFDGDGLNNLEEYIAGVDPTDSGSVFAISNAVPDSEGFTVQWPAVEGRIYDIYWTDSLANEPQYVTSVQWPFGQFDDPEAANRTQGFYLIDVRLAE